MKKLLAAVLLTLTAATATAHAEMFPETQYKINADTASVSADVSAFVARSTDALKNAFPTATPTTPFDATLNKYFTDARDAGRRVGLRNHASCEDASDNYQFKTTSAAVNTMMGLRAGIKSHASGGKIARDLGVPNATVKDIAKVWIFIEQDKVLQQVAVFKTACTYAK